MKLQLQPQSLRLRLDEAELAALLAGQPLGLDVGQGTTTLFTLRVGLGQAAGLHADGPAWRLTLPEPELRAYIETLPRRDALALTLGGDLRLDFEVDVRDSLQVRGPRRR